MLARLSIRDIVLIDRLDIDFTSRLSVLTGETGAGKSILLDAFALALGARGDVALVRQGAEQGQVTAAFELPTGPSGRAVMAANDIPAEDELILRRVQFADGRTRAFVNDQPVSAQALQGAGRGAGRDPRPARRARAGRYGDASPPARCLRRPRGQGRRGRTLVGGVARARKRDGGAARRGRAGATRGRFASPRGRGTAAACSGGRRRKPRSRNGAPP